MEFRELAKDPVFSDIEDYRDEVEELAKRTGLSVEEAYLAKFGRSKIKAHRQDIERSRTKGNCKYQKEKKT